MSSASYSATKVEKTGPGIDPMTPIRSDVCPHCKAQRVELYSFNGYPQKYSEAVNLRLKGYNISYDKFEIRYMKCQSCNREFVIDWTQGFPVPLLDTFKTNQFFREFVQGI